MTSLDAEEEMLHKELARLRKRHEDEIKPIVDRIVKIRLIRPPKYTLRNMVAGG
jgi:hypothetical protein